MAKAEGDSVTSGDVLADETDSNKCRSRRGRHPWENSRLEGRNGAVNTPIAIMLDDSEVTATDSLE